MLDIPGWCPLYIGAGFGTNWYDAKKTEIPVQVQDIMVDTWGETGLDWWDGDTEKLFDWEVGLINDYKRDRVIEYIRNEENWGKVLKKVEAGFINEVLDEINAGRHVDGVVDTNVKSKKDVVESLWEFCKAFGISREEFERADIKKPEFKAEEVSSVFDEDTDDEDITPKLNPLDFVKMKVNQLGVSLDNNTMIIYFKYDDSDPVLMGLLHSVISRYPGKYEVRAVRNGEIFETGLKMDMKGYRELMSTYLKRKSSMALRA